MKPSMDLSILIVNWNALPYLRACLNSIAQNVHGIRYEVIVVDNSRVDGCEAMLRADFPAVRLVIAESNLGFAKANNRGYQLASGKCVLFLNPDTEVRGPAVQEMAEWLDTHPEAGAAGARLLNSDGTLQESCIQAFPTIWNQMLDSGILHRWIPHTSPWGRFGSASQGREFIPVDAISGACFMVRREAFEKAGRFTESYFMYSDDLDLSYKIHRAGYSVVLLPRCEILHHGGMSSAQRSGCFADVAQRTSMEHFLRCTRGPLYSATYRLTTGLVACLRILLATGGVLLTEGAQRKRLVGAILRWFRILGWSIGRAQQPDSL